MNITHIRKQAFLALMMASGVVTALMLSFFILEPTVGQAVTSDTFRVRQQINDQISFLVQPGPTVTMVGAINGLTGGNATGSTIAVVRTNNPAGYIMTINWTSNGTNHAMRGETTDSSAIRNYATGTILTTETPTYLFDTSSTSAVFAYTVNASGTPQNVLDDSFLDNGSACGVGTNGSINRCWMSAASSTYQIIDTEAAAPDGSTTTLKFRVYVPNAPSPSLDADWYTATATLTATNK